MRIWCDIIVEHRGEWVRSQPNYQLFDSVSRDVDELSRIRRERTEEYARYNIDLKRHPTLLSDGEVTTVSVSV